MIQSESIIFACINFLYHPCPGLRRRSSHHTLSWKKQGKKSWVYPQEAKTEKKNMRSKPKHSTSLCPRSSSEREPITTPSQSLNFQPTTRDRRRRYLSLPSPHIPHLSLAFPRWRERIVHPRLRPGSRLGPRQLHPPPRIHRAPHRAFAFTLTGYARRPRRRHDRRLPRHIIQQEFKQHSREATSQSPVPAVQVQPGHIVLFLCYSPFS
jgi:hypothetical protein